MWLSLLPALPVQRGHYQQGCCPCEKAGSQDRSWAHPHLLLAVSFPWPSQSRESWTRDELGKLGKQRLFYCLIKIQGKCFRGGNKKVIRTEMHCFKLQK